jgi:hypothetical protein
MVGYSALTNGYLVERFSDPAPQRLDKLLCGHHHDRFRQRDDDQAVNGLDHALDPLNSATRPVPLPVSMYVCMGPHGFTTISAFRNCSGI